MTQTDIDQTSQLILATTTMLLQLFLRNNERPLEVYVTA